MRAVYESANSAMLGSIQEVLHDGVATAPRGKGTKEITSLSFVIRNPRNRVCTSRTNYRKAYPAALLAWNLARRTDVEGLMRWNPNAVLFSDDEVHVQGENYGERMWASLQGAMHVLRHDRQSRRCWVSVWKPGREYGEQAYDPDARDDMPVMKSSNVPCCIGFGLRIIHNRLVMQTLMRSQSLWGVFPYDVFLFTVLQELIANEMGVDLGWYEHTMLSAHVYDHELKWIEQAIPQQGEPKPMPAIERTLTQAAEVWPQVLEACNGNYEAYKIGAVKEDPIIGLMTDDVEAEELAS